MLSHQLWKIAIIFILISAKYIETKATDKFNGSHMCYMKQNEFLLYQTWYICDMAITPIISYIKGKSFCIYKNMAY